MRLLGAVMLIVASSGLGMAIGSWYIQRARQLRDLTLALQVLETEIAFAVSDLPSALRRAGDAVEEPVRGLFRSAASIMDEHPGLSGPQAWMQALEKVRRSLALRDSDVAVLRSACVRLGASDAPDQIRYLRAAQHGLRRLADEAEGQREDGVRLWRYLGACSGLILALLLY